MKITLPITAPSLNDWYSGKHWSFRQKVKNLWREEVGLLCMQKKIKPITKFPVKISTITYFTDRRGRDSINWATAAKLAEDGLVKQGILPDDNTKYVKGHYVEVVEGHDKNETVITIEEAESS